jgi:hypothetical protein
LHAPKHSSIGTACRCAGDNVGDLGWEPIVAQNPADHLIDPEVHQRSVHVERDELRLLSTCTLLQVLIESSQSESLVDCRP